MSSVSSALLINRRPWLCPTFFRVLYFLVCCWLNIETLGTVIHQFLDYCHTCHVAPLRGWWDPVKASGQPFNLIVGVYITHKEYGSHTTQQRLFRRCKEYNPLVVSIEVKKYIIHSVYKTVIPSFHHYFYCNMCRIVRLTILRIFLCKHFFFLFLEAVQAICCLGDRMMPVQPSIHWGSTWVALNIHEQNLPFFLLFILFEHPNFEVALVINIHISRGKNSRARWQLSFYDTNQNLIKLQNPSII